MLVPNNDPPPKEWAINLTLNKSSTTSANFLNLTFYFILLSPINEGPLRYDCTLTAIKENGKPIAKGVSIHPTAMPPLTDLVFPRHGIPLYPLHSQLRRLHH